MTSEDKNTRALCDEIAHRALALMLEQGAPLGVAMDRILTFAAAQVVVADGTVRAGAVFRHIANMIDDGVLTHLEPHPGSMNH